MWQDADGAFIAYQEPTPDDVALAAASIAALSEQMWHLMHPGLEAKDSPELLEGQAGEREQDKAGIKKKEKKKKEIRTAIPAAG